MSNKVKWRKLFPSREIVCLTFWLVLLFVPHASIAKDGSPASNIEKLQETKLLCEIEKMQTEIQLASSRWAKFTQAAPFMTAIIALIGVFITFWKQLNESSRQREADKSQIEREALRRFDEKFNQIVEGLGSPVAAIQAGAAVSILSYLRPEYNDFHEQVFLILIASLKTAHDEVTNSFLVQAFERSVSITSMEVEKKNAGIDEKEEKISLDLSHCNLAGVRLPCVNLSWANVQESHLEKVILRGACLQRLSAQGAKCHGAQFSQADLRKSVFDGAVMPSSRFCASDLRWVHFKKCDLRDAKFQRATLQSALFNGADLRGARFEQADINNATFTGAKIDKIAMISIVKAYNWRQADFDKNIKDALIKLELQVQNGRNAQP